MLLVVLVCLQLQDHRSGSHSLNLSVSLSQDSNSFIGNGEINLYIAKALITLYNKKEKTSQI